MDHVHLPAGIARNVAVEENVFIMIVCVVNKIPLLIVGEPGCSKTLSFTVLKDNMKGLNSPDHFFQDMPVPEDVRFQVPPTFLSL